MGRDERCWALSRRTDAEVAVRRRTRAAAGHRRLSPTETGKGITMRFGHFDDEAREYVITTPHTPYPWINYLGSQEFFSLISHQAGGYSFYRDARMRRLTRYRYNNVPTDTGGRYLYVNDGGDVWSPSYLPVKAELDHFETRHGLGYTRITGERRGVRVETLYLSLI